MSKLRILLLLALVVGIAGYWGPWIAHRAVSLIIIGQDMGEFVKFLSEVRNGTVPMVRQLFYLPPFCACLCLALLAANPRLSYPRLARAFLLAAILPISLALLPPVVSMPVLQSSEFRLQAAGVICCWLLVPGWWLLRRIPAGINLAALSALGLAASLLPLWQFLTILPAIQAIYKAPIYIGWGLVATTAGFLLFGLFSLLGLSNHLSQRLEAG